MKMSQMNTVKAQLAQLTTYEIKAKGAIEVEVRKDNVDKQFLKTEEDVFLTD